MRKVCVIPGRMGSSRFPGKPLVSLKGIPMIIHCAAKALISNEFDRVIVATCDLEIQRVVETFGVECIMTSDRHERASDRVAEVASILLRRNELDVKDVIVMLQGDEPLIRPDQLVLAANSLMEGFVAVNLYSPIGTTEEMNSPDIIKVVLGVDNAALYMSRATIPFNAGVSGIGHLGIRQVCVIPFWVSSLVQFAKLEMTPLEKLEAVDMLRFIENNMKVKMVETDNAGTPVDRPADVPIVEKLLRSDATFLNGYPFFG